MSFPILTVIALLPFVGGVITMMLRGAAARATGMVFSLVTLVLGVYAFIVGVNGTNLSETHRWIRAVGAWYALGGDGLALTKILLVVILVPVVLLAEWHVGDDETARWSTGAFSAWPSCLRDWQSIASLPPTSCCSTSCSRPPSSRCTSSLQDGAVHDEAEQR